MEEFSSAWFNNASKAWMKNKKRRPGIDGQYYYVCNATKLDGEQCGKAVKEAKSYCGIHAKKYGKKKNNSKD